MSELMVHGLSEELIERLQRMARTRGVTTNELIVNVLRSHAAGEQSAHRTIMDSEDIEKALDTWTPTESEAFEDAVKALEDLTEPKTGHKP